MKTAIFAIVLLGLVAATSANMFWYNYGKHRSHGTHKPLIDVPAEEDTLGDIAEYDDMDDLEEELYLRDLADLEDELEWGLDDEGVGWVGILGVEILEKQKWVKVKKCVFAGQNKVCSRHFV